MAAKAPFVEARSEQHRALGREELAKLFREGDREAAFELARRVANRLRNGKEE